MTAAGVAGEPTNTFSPKSVTIKLPVPVDISSFQVDPGQTCGTGNSSSTGELQIETSPNGLDWTPAADPTFTGTDNGHLNAGRPHGRRHQRALRQGDDREQPGACTVLGHLPGDGTFGGCQFASLTEFAVFGVPSP